MTFATNATFEAPPEIVFDALTDPLGIARWLPRDVSRNPAGAGLMRITHDSAEPLMGVAEVRMTYLPVPDRAWVAQVLISPLPAGGTGVTVAVDSAGESIPPLVESALLALRREVGERFTTG